ncbi:RNA polymerase sigma-70 factor, ECF subfamily [Clostridium cavendishii DSM 21758]|uniref:RNA polymerase sigma-70 factor, ECF subfamily n=1 Tax=Clostridium cavendishii DSM 21758 TaxID=1121302 RepID=A0A1M6M1M8_9CLOT|nr:RNA polymerase sigma factor [Clostridium cavendishii]SHJ77358.1 RNA polymerase sigma-70 factor, ECF subfamily [Clostridium cavendishii DSM 21758]
MTLTDEQLVNEIIDGNKSAMEVLVNRNYKLVFSIIYRNTQDYHVSLDLTQETFMKMLVSINSYKSNKGNFKNWIITIALNACKDYFKSAYVRRNVLTDEIIQEHEETNIINLIEKNEDRRVVKESIMNLPELQREALILKYYNDMSIKDISEITGTNESTVKSRLRLGVDKLKKIFGGEKLYERASK